MWPRSAEAGCRGREVARTGILAEQSLSEPPLWHFYDTGTTAQVAAAEPLQRNIAGNPTDIVDLLHRRQGAKRLLVVLSDGIQNNLPGGKATQEQCLEMQGELVNAVGDYLRAEPDNAFALVRLNPLSQDCAPTPQGKLCPPGAEGRCWDVPLPSTVVPDAEAPPSTVLETLHDCIAAGQDIPAWGAREAVARALSGAADVARVRATLDRLAGTREAFVRALERMELDYKVSLAAPDRSFEDVALVGSGRDWDCTGIAIAPNAVLTAAHCPSARVAFGGSRRAALRVHDVEERATPDDDRIDVALLRLDRPTDVSTRSRRSHSDRQPPRGMLRLVGFGARSSDGQRGFGNRTFLDLPVSGWGCDGSRPQTTGCISGLEMVIPGSGGQDSCAGDSGGPLVELIGDGADCGYRLVGVTSRRVADARATCGSGGIYTRVDVLDEWLRTTLSRWDSSGSSNGGGE